MPRRRRTSGAPSRLIPRALRHLRERGVDVDALVRRIGLPGDSERLDEVPIAPDELEQLLGAASVELGDPLLALRLPEAIDWPSYHVGELAARASPNLREAFARVVRYAPLFYAPLVFSCEERDGELVVSQRLRSGARGGRFGNEYGLASTLLYARRLSGVALAPRRVWFAHRRPAAAADVASFFGAPALFGRADSGLAFDAAAADLASVASDPRLLATAERLADRALGEHEPEGDFVGAVAGAMKAALGPGIDTRAVARRLRVSVRTLQRRLEEHGRTFSEVLDGVRRDIGCDLVRAGRLGQAAIADRLGFSDPAAFSRAFKRWTGHAPSVWRSREVG